MIQSRDLSDEYDRAVEGKAFSKTYLRIIKNAVVGRFIRAQTMPDSDYCDADVEDVIQEVAINLLKFFQRKDFRMECDAEQKSRFLVQLAYRFSIFGVWQFYRSKLHTRKVKSQPKIFLCEMKIFRQMPEPERPDPHRWESFVYQVELRMPPKRAKAAISLASTDTIADAARLAGISYSKMNDFARFFRRTLPCDPDGLLGGLEPRLCVVCGDRIRSNAHNAKYCSAECRDQVERQKLREWKAAARRRLKEVA
ncbi:MAG: hypothetical protein AAF802_18460 [Planctomycetota bacterium]